jgi:hypothetical protein
VFLVRGGSLGIKVRPRPVRLGCPNQKIVRKHVGVYRAAEVPPGAGFVSASCNSVKPQMCNLTAFSPWLNMHSWSCYTGYLTSYNMDCIALQPIYWCEEEPSEPLVPQYFLHARPYLLVWTLVLTCCHCPQHGSPLFLRPWDWKWLHSQNPCTFT